MNAAVVCVYVLTQRKVARNKGFMARGQGGHQWAEREKCFSKLRQRQDKMICTEYDIDLVMLRETNGLERRVRERMERGEQEGQKLAATVLPCHCLRGFCVNVGSLLMSYHCVCVRACVCIRVCAYVRACICVFAITAQSRMWQTTVEQITMCVTSNYMSVSGE